MFRWNALCVVIALGLAGCAPSQVDESNPPQTDGKADSLSSLDDWLLSHLADWLDRQVASATPEIWALQSNLRQSEAISGGEIHCRTETTYPVGEPEQVIAALRSPWSNWWGHSRTTGYHTTDSAGASDGALDFDFEPLVVDLGYTFSVTKVAIHVGPLVEEIPDQLWSMEVSLHMIEGRGFEGPMRIEVERTAAGTVSRSIWGPDPAHGVRSSPLPASVAAHAHLLTENGLADPFRPFSGYAGLIEYLRGNQ